MIVIDSEFQSLIPPLADDEYDSLEKSLVENGYQDWREPIITWNGTIIDGHNRYAICDEHGIPFRQMEREFDSRDAAKIWIIENQSKLRRNLNPGQKATLEIDLHEAEVREAARLRQVQTLKQNQNDNRWDPKSPTVAIDQEPKKGRTAEILAKQAGVGPMTIKRALRVKKEDPELYNKVRSGEVSVTTAYKQVTNPTAPSESPKKARYAEDGRRICSICGKPIDEGGHYQDKLNWHYQCGLKHANEVQRKYRDADSDLRNNVAVYTIESLKAELLASAESMKEALKESIAINESMGVQLTAKQKKDLNASVAHVIRTINRI